MTPSYPGGYYPGQPPAQQPPGGAPTTGGPTFPAVYYSRKTVVPPLVIKDQAMLDRLNAIQPNEWDTVPPTQTAASEAKDQYPKLFFNVNIDPQIIGSAEQEAALGSDWKQFQFTQALVNAAQAQVTAALRAQAAKAAAQPPPAADASGAQYQYQQYPQYGTYPP